MNTKELIWGHMTIHFLPSWLHSLCFCLKLLCPFPSISGAQTFVNLCVLENSTFLSICANSDSYSSHCLKTPASCINLYCLQPFSLDLCSSTLDAYQNNLENFFFLMLIPRFYPQVLTQLCNADWYCYSLKTSWWILSSARNETH